MTFAYIQLALKVCQKPLAQVPNWFHNCDIFDSLVIRIVCNHFVQKPTRLRKKIKHQWKSSHNAIHGPAWRSGGNLTTFKLKMSSVHSFVWLLLYMFVLGKRTSRQNCRVWAWCNILPPLGPISCCNILQISWNFTVSLDWSSAQLESLVDFHIEVYEQARKHINNLNNHSVRFCTPDTSWTQLLAQKWNV